MFSIILRSSPNSSAKLAIKAVHSQIRTSAFPRRAIGYRCNLHINLALRWLGVLFATADSSIRDFHTFMVLVSLDFTRFASSFPLLFASVITISSEVSSSLSTNSLRFRVQRTANCNSIMAICCLHFQVWSCQKYLRALFIRLWVPNIAVRWTREAGHVDEFAVLSAHCYSTAFLFHFFFHFIGMHSTIPQ